MKKITQKRGFTLIELLFVISIIGILSGIILQVVSSARGKARDTQRATGIRSVKIALQDYYNDPAGGDGKYPASDSVGPPTYTFVALNTPLVPKYLNMLPTEPLSIYNEYKYVKWGSEYAIRLYNERLAGYCKTGTAVTTQAVGPWAGTQLCPF